MNATVKQGKYNDGSSRVQYASHGVKGQSYAGFYMFLVTLVSMAGFAVAVFITH